MCVSVGGEFGAYMQVHIQNDGPVTLHIESPQFAPAKEVTNYSQSHAYEVYNTDYVCLFCQRKVQGAKKGGKKENSTDTAQTGSADSATAAVAELEES